MGKKRIFTGVVFVLMVVLSGCAEVATQPEERDTEIVCYSFSESEETAATVPTADVADESVKGGETPEEKTEPEIDSDTENATVTEPTVTEDEEKGKDKDKEPVSTTKQETPECKEEAAKEPLPEETEPPETAEPIETPMNESEPEQKTRPTEVQATEESTADIAYWINYARSYATEVGLSFDETATDCWDNPITVNASRNGIESDITSRLNRYRNIEGFTSVWIWAEKVSETEYELYIGYS